jgi:hypothetical protein
VWLWRARWLRLVLPSGDFLPAIAYSSLLCDGYEERQITCWCFGATSSPYRAPLTSAVSWIRHEKRPCGWPFQSSVRAPQHKIRTIHNTLFPLHFPHCNMLPRLYRDHQLRKSYAPRISSTSEKVSQRPPSTLYGSENVDIVANLRI